LRGHAGGQLAASSSKQVEQQFFSHISCFKSRMWHNVPAEVEELAGDLESENSDES
jgi:hypothetical protein